MDHVAIAIITGFLVGTLGTLIGAGGGFILVPVLLFAHPDFKPEIITAISMAVVACNAISGTVAYARAGRIDYKSGSWFALFTIPGSILGVLVTKHISKYVFDVFFGGLLFVIAVYLLLKKDATDKEQMGEKQGMAWRHRIITDNSGETFTYTYNNYLGLFISAVVGFISPILGIGGGIIHVPALVNWLRFPVHIATATSHFILAVMSVVSVWVHFREGNYNDPLVMRLVVFLGIGVIAGAQLGAVLSGKLKGSMIVKALAVSLALVGLRILFLK